nr:hypothetical protein [Tanacetum cinerariifolium]
LQGCCWHPPTALETHLSPLANRLEDIPPKTGDIETVEILCRKVLVKKEKKKKKAEAKATVKANDDGQVEKVTGKRRFREEGASCSPLRDVVNENVDEHVADGGAGNEHGNEDLVNEGHGDNTGGLSGLYTQPSPANQSGYSVRRFDMLANLFTPTDNEFLNDGMPDGSAIKRSWRLLCQSTQQQANVLLRFEALSEECKKEMVKLQSAYDENVFAYDQLLKDYKRALTIKIGLNERADWIKQLEGELKKSEEDAYQLRVIREKLVVECGDGEMVRQKIINEYLPTFVRRLHQSAEYKRALGEAILEATPNVDHAASSTFMEKNEKLFDKRCPYVSKVSSAYLRDPSELQNVMPDETGPTPDQ